MTGHLLLTFAAISLVVELKAEPRALCAPSTSIVVPGGTYRTTPDFQQRVEVRRCQPGVTDHPQLVAWSDGARRPSLVIDTGAEQVMQIAVAQNAAAVVVAAGTTDRIYVITFNAGKPVLRLQRATRGVSSLRVKDHQVEVTIEPESRGEPEVLVFP